MTNIRQPEESVGEQVPYPLFSTLLPRLSIARLTPYLAESASNQKKAIQLYQWNIDLAGAVHEALHIFEVVLRNAMDEQLREWNSRQPRLVPGGSTDRGAYSRDWIRDSAPLLRRLVSTEALERATKHADRAVGARREVTHDDVLAQLPFGTWRFLLPTRDPGRRLLWDACLRYSFPYLARSADEVTRSVSEIYQLRNRVAHLEPLLNAVVVRRQFCNMRDVLGEICP